MIPLDSSFASAVNPHTIGKLNSQQMEGLASLFPQGQSGALMTPNLSRPNITLPAPTIGKNAGQSFGWEGSAPFEAAPTPNLNPNSQPYFDPNYPYESMVAEENFMGQGLPEAVTEGQNARGLTYSGVGPSMLSRAQDEIKNLTPGVNDSNAFNMDMSRLYGANVANNLGSPAAEKASGLESLAQNAIQQYGINHFGGQSPSQFQGYLGGIQDQLSSLIPPNGGALGALVSNPAAKNQPDKGPLNPDYGVVDYATGKAYASPGYFYNPNQPPDYSRMPWLTSPTSPTSGVA